MGVASLRSASLATASSCAPRRESDGRHCFRAGLAGSRKCKPGEKNGEKGEQQAEDRICKRGRKMTLL